MAMRRSRIEVIHDILVKMGDGSIKTEIMRRSNLNTEQATNYLGYLQTKGIIEKQQKRNPGIIYSKTQKGINLLRKINELYDLLYNEWDT